MRRLPYVRRAKSVSGPRSVLNAIERPSGDQAGSRSAYRSFVSRLALPSRSVRNRSLIPPSRPVNTRRRPSGDQLGFDTPFSPNFSRCETRSRFRS